MPESKRRSVSDTVTSPTTTTSAAAPTPEKKQDQQALPGSSESAVAPSDLPCPQLAPVPSREPPPDSKRNKKR